MHELGFNLNEAPLSVKRLSSSLTEYAMPEGAQQSMKTATVMNMTRAERRSFFSSALQRGRRTI